MTFPIEPWLDLAEGPPIDVEHGQLTFVGNATVVLRFAGFTLLTDPNFLHAGQHAYLGLGLRSKRLEDPALAIAELPDLDLVVLSHHHGDHFDQVAAEQLDKDLPIVTEPHSAEKLVEQGFRRAIPVQTWQSQVFRRGPATLTVTAMPGKHAPEPLQRLLPKVMGSMLDYAVDGETRLRVYITGDTLLHDRLHEIPERYPDIDLCLIHLGGTKVAGILLTMDAEQGVKALRIVRPRTAVPIHYDDYTVFTSGLDDFRQAVDRARLATEIHEVGRGETWTFDAPGARPASL